MHQKIVPNLIIPGAAKSGTSSLHNYLNLHPNIIMAEKKEPHFFTVKERYEQGLDFYRDIFPKEAGNNNARVEYYGESSTSYLPNPEAINRIKTTLPNAKIIVILRNPVERSISHYKWAVALGLERKKFINAVRENIHIGTDYKTVNKGGIWKGYFTSSLYGRHLSNLYNKFDRTNILVITTEDLDKDPLRTLNKCFSFLGTETLEGIEEIRTNVTEDKSRSRGGLLRYNGIKSISLKKIAGAIRRNINYNENRLKKSVDNIAKSQLREFLNEDIEIFRTLHPELVAKWKL